MQNIPASAMSLRASGIVGEELFPVLFFSLGGLLLTALVCLAIPDWVVTLFNAWTQI